MWCLWGIIVALLYLLLHQKDLKACISISHSIVIECFFPFLVVSAFSSHFFYLFLIICLVLWASMCLSLQVDYELSEDWIWSLLFVTPQDLKQFFTKCALCVCDISVVLKELIGGMSTTVPLFYLVETERHRGLISSSWLEDLCSSLTTSAVCLFHCALLFLSWSWFS